MCVGTTKHDSPRRRWLYPVVGRASGVNRRALLLVPAAVFLPGSVAFAVLSPPHTILTAVLLGCFFVAGFGFAVAGLRASVPVGGRDVPWYAFAGVADVALGVGMVLNATRMLGGGAEDAFLSAVTAVSGLPLLFVGVDYLRGGRHFDLTAFE
ncbi:hypothetical protein SAMN04487947_2758 [Halogeometricum rufum]|uniref:Uncharacterized protein n=1 Tax=Halogeometricum rufum TaxID=553469 RepID=A0A1I6I200_9EURY|nr:hypothetical protein SAMN04487947_2758 [Halogeometricum rufum]